MTQNKNVDDTGFFRRLALVVRHSDKKSRSFGSKLRRRLLAGFLVAFPLVVTIFFARFIFGLLDRWFHPITRYYFDLTIPGAGALLSLIALYLLGVIATNMFGGRLLAFFERRISAIPLLSPIYQGARQITEALQVRDTSQFRRVVLLAFPHAGVQSVGFVTREFATGTRFYPEPSALVFVPTTPNPTSGYLISAPLADLRSLDISVEEGIKFVISGGLLTPPELVGKGDGSLSSEWEIETAEE
ncbi:MAG: DUF502 domain-containing protein [bacterium]|nr:DUF502 domain-containing protein [bacterium]